MQPWAFSDSPDTACVTSADIINKLCPILYASREVDEDDEVTWQFLTDPSSFDFEKAKLVRLDSIVTFDHSLCELADLPVGMSAARMTVDSPWLRRKCD